MSSHGLLTFGRGAAVSPDGQRVAYVFQTDGLHPMGGLWVVNADGTDPKHIYGGSVLLAPLWSPDGARIALVSGEGLMVINSDGSESGLVSKESGGLDAYSPLFTWSPDSRRLATIAIDGPGAVSPVNWYRGNFTGANIHVVDVETGEERALLDGTGNIDPAWSPDGSQIVFVSNRSGAPELWAVNADGSNLRRLTSDGRIIRSPIWRQQ